MKTFWKFISERHLIGCFLVRYYLGNPLFAHLTRSFIMMVLIWRLNLCAMTQHALDGQSSTYHHTSHIFVGLIGWWLSRAGIVGHLFRAFFKHLHPSWKSRRLQSRVLVNLPNQCSTSGLKALQRIVSPQWNHFHYNIKTPCISNNK